jgi:hypothetical protein
MTQTKDNGMYKAIGGIVHWVGNGGVERGACRVMVGACKAYEEGPTTLITLSQGASLVEVAVLPEDALELAQRLLESARGLIRH